MSYGRAVRWADKEIGGIASIGKLLSNDRRELTFAVLYRIFCEKGTVNQAFCRTTLSIAKSRKTYTTVTVKNYKFVDGDRSFLHDSRQNINSHHLLCTFHNMRESCILQKCRFVQDRRFWDFMLLCILHKMAVLCKVCFIMRNWKFLHNYFAYLENNEYLCKTHNYYNFEIIMTKQSQRA